MPGQDAPTRVILVAIQDLGTGMIVGWNLDFSETRESVRLANAEMVEDFGIQADMYLDSGRAFASKLISGGSPTRFQFRVRADEPSGVLTQLGVVATGRRRIPANQSRSSEPSGIWPRGSPSTRSALAPTRATRLAKPENYGKAAIDFADLEKIVGKEIIRHNVREGRRGPA